MKKSITLILGFFFLVNISFGQQNEKKVYLKAGNGKYLVMQYDAQGNPTGMKAIADSAKKATVFLYKGNKDIFSNNGFNDKFMIMDLKSNAYIDPQYDGTLKFYTNRDKGALMNFSRTPNVLEIHGMKSILYIDKDGNAGCCYDGKGIPTGANSKFTIELVK